MQKKTLQAALHVGMLSILHKKKDNKDQKNDKILHIILWSVFHIFYNL